MYAKRWGSALVGRLLQRQSRYWSMVFDVQPVEASSVR